MAEEAGGTPLQNPKEKMKEKIEEIAQNESQSSAEDVEQEEDRLPVSTQSAEQDEYAEVPEEVLDEKDLEELKGLEEESEEKEKKHPPRRGEPTREEVIEAWHPKTKLGEEVKAEKIKNIDEILDNKRKILEPEIVDSLINIKSDLLSIGQSKGKFGGGKRRAWRQTQRKTKEGNIPTFSAMAVIGDEKGHVGIGSGKAMETLPARDKAIRKAKLNVIKVKRACAGFDCDCPELHTVPFKVTGKAGSVRVTLIPAPQGTGLVVGSELKKILKIAGIRDVYSRTSGRIRTTFNLIKACMDALEKTNQEVKK